MDSVEGEPDYKALLKEMTAARDTWKKNCAEALKKLQQCHADEKPVFGVFHP